MPCAQIADQISMKSDRDDQRLVGTPLQRVLVGRAQEHQRPLAMVGEPVWQVVPQLAVLHP